jgi:tetratricopeptide (TPR) repeat protein
LETRLHHAGPAIVTEAWVTDLSSGRTLGHLKGEYSSNDSLGVSKAIIATVTGALRLRAGVPRESVSPTAYSSYIQAIGLLRQDAYNAVQAIALFQKAIELDPRSALPYAGLAEAQIQESIKNNDRALLELAGASVERARAINSDSVPVLLVSGLLQQQHGRYESAIHDFTRATELEPNNPVGWKRLANAYAESNRAEEAIATYRRAIQTDPNYYATYIEFGNFYLFRNQFREAEEMYRRAATSAPDLPNGHMNLGLALMRQARFGEAEQSLLHALRLRKSPRLLMNIGALYYAQEQYTKAIPFFEESVASGPPSAIRLRDLGDVYRHVGRTRDASAAYRSARDLAQDEVTRNPRQANSRVLLALVCAFLGDTRRAESEASQALAIEPENAMVMRGAVITYEVLGQREETLRMLGNAPRYLLEELSHDPDVKDLQHDPRFLALIQKQSTH